MSRRDAPAPTPCSKGRDRSCSCSMERLLHRNCLARGSSPTAGLLKPCTPPLRKSTPVKGPAQGRRACHRALMLVDSVARGNGLLPITVGRMSIASANDRGARRFDRTRGSGGFSAGCATSRNDAARVKVVRDIKHTPQRQNAVSLCQ